MLLRIRVGDCILSSCLFFNICLTPWSAGYLRSWCNCFQLFAYFLLFWAQIEALLGIRFVKPPWNQLINHTLTDIMHIVNYCFPDYIIQWQTKSLQQTNNAFNCRLKKQTKKIIRMMLFTLKNFKTFPLIYIP